METKSLVTKILDLLYRLMPVAIAYFVGQMSQNLIANQSSVVYMFCGVLGLITLLYVLSLFMFESALFSVKLIRELVGMKIIAVVLATISCIYTILLLLSLAPYSQGALVAVFAISALAIMFEEYLPELK